MIKAFVFGKFLPFHKGHEAMIRFALSHCDLLTVLVCCSNKELISDSIRKSWIESTFESVPNIEVKTFNYDESELPNTSKSSAIISKIWANIFKKELPNHSLLITSEPYGDYVAEYMHIKHIVFDIDRKMVPISATDISLDVYNNWEFLAESVKPYLALKVVILGTESTGKSTIAKQLVSHFNGSLVSEAGREIIANSKSFRMDDLYAVAKQHSHNIELAKEKGRPIIFIDTDIHVTKSYSRFIFNEELKVDSKLYESNKADLYLFLNKDVPYIQDGTRLHEADRNLLEYFHRQILKEHQIEWIEITGSWEERFQKAIKAVEKLVQLPRKLRYIQ